LFGPSSPPFLADSIAFRPLVDVAVCLFAYFRDAVRRGFLRAALLIIRVIGVDRFDNRKASVLPSRS